MWHIGSDIHIGSGAEADKYFYAEFLSRARAGDTVVLLGDIVDYWFSSFDQGVRQLTLNWRILIEQLKRLADIGVHIIYIPGNHDSFVFFNEWSVKWGCPHWLQRLYERDGQFAEVYDLTTRNMPISEYATIHYPLLTHVFGKVKVIFTHGHWTEQVWPFLTDDPTDPFLLSRNDGFLKNWAPFKAAAIAFAYNHPGVFRRLFLSMNKVPEIIRYYGPDILKEGFLHGIGDLFGKERSDIDPYKDLRRAEDVYFSVVSDARRDYVREIAETADFDEEKFTNILGNRISQFPGFFKDDFSPNELLGIFRGHGLIKKWSLEMNPDAEWAHASQRLERIFAQPIRTYSIKRTHIEEETEAPLSDLLGHVLIHGHFHVPRRGAFVIDDGAMLKVTKSFTLTTFVTIDDDGTIRGPSDLY